MKKLIIAAMAAFLPLCASTASAQGLFSKKQPKGRQDLSAYMQGAVTEESGKVVFRQVVDAPGKTKSQLFQNLQQWASFRYMPNAIQGEWNDDNYFHNFDFAKVLTAEAGSGVIECQADEEIVFTNKTLARDASHINYTLRITVADGRVEAVVSNIAYTYNLSDTPSRIAAEDWITDKEAISKKGTFYKGSGKFRVKTVDLKNQLFKEIGEAALK